MKKKTKKGAEGAYSAQYLTATNALLLIKNDYYLFARRRQKYAI